MYESAHFISSRTLSGFEGYPFGDDLPDYPTRLRSSTTSRPSPAIAGSRIGSPCAPRWRGGAVRRRLGGSARRRRAAHLLPPGRGHRPPVGAALPGYPGEFAGEQIHSRDYRSADLFRGRRVLIVGAGTRAATSPATPPRPRPRGAERAARLLVLPQAPVRQALRRLRPRRSAAAAAARAGDVDRRPEAAGRRPDSYGLPAPDHRVLESHPIMNTQVLHYIGHGDLVARPDVAELRGDGSSSRTASRSRST